MLVASLVVAAAPAAASEGAGATQPTKVVASGLANPRGLAFGPDGALYVTEAGKGGAGPCVAGPEGTACYGPSGAITKVKDGKQRRVVSGLPSLAAPDGSGAIGPQDISFRGATASVVVGLGADPRNRPQLGPAGSRFGQLLTMTPSGRVIRRVDVSAYEAKKNPDGGAIDSNPFGVLRRSGFDVVADAGANALLKVGANKRISTLAVFPDRMVDAPPFLGLPPGTKIPMQAVPTSVAVGPDGAYYVGQLTGFPFPVGAANVYRVVPGHAPTVYASGFTNIVDIAFGRDGSLYVLEIAKNSLLSGDPAGALLRVPKHGGQATVVASDGLVNPTAFVFGRDGNVYVSNNSLSPDAGQVVRIDLKTYGHKS
jgi:sugar lactone lactonase YvrE